METNFVLDHIKYQDNGTHNVSDSGFSESVTLPYSIIRDYVPKETNRIIDGYKIEIGRLRDENENLTIGAGNLVRENGQLTKRNDELTSELRRLKENACLPINGFNYFLDTRTFKGATENWLMCLWDNMLELVKLRAENGGYLIESAADTAPIYILITKNPSFPCHFCSNYNDFEYAWNVNVVARIEDVSRKEKLRLKKNRLKAALKNKYHYWDISISQWKRNMLEGVHARIYERALKIKEEIEKWRFERSLPVME